MSLTANVADWGSLRVLFEESDLSGEFASFLANFERYIRYACVVRFRLPNEAEEIVSAVRIRLVVALQDEEFRIRVSVEAFLKSLIYQEVRDLLKEQQKHECMQQFEPEALAEIPDQTEWFGDDEWLELDPTIVDRVAMLNEAIQRVRSQVAQKTWNLFWDITINGMPTPEAALKYGKQYSAAHKANARILQRVRDEGKKLGLA